jgi:hypothetical protein
MLRALAGAAAPSSAAPVSITAAARSSLFVT